MLNLNDIKNITDSLKETMELSNEQPVMEELKSIPYSEVLRLTDEFDLLVNAVPVEQLSHTEIECFKLYKEAVSLDEYDSMVFDDIVSTQGVMDTIKKAGEALSNSMKKIWSKIVEFFGGQQAKEEMKELENTMESVETLTEFEDDVKEIEEAITNSPSAEEAAKVSEEVVSADEEKPPVNKSIKTVADANTTIAKIRKKYNGYPFLVPFFANLGKLLEENRHADEIEFRNIRIESDWLASNENVQYKTMDEAVKAITDNLVLISDIIEKKIKPLTLQMETYLANVRDRNYKKLDNDFGSFLLSWDYKDSILNPKKVINAVFGNKKIKRDDNVSGGYELVEQVDFLGPADLIMKTPNSEARLRLKKFHQKLSKIEVTSTDNGNANNGTPTNRKLGESSTRGMDNTTDSSADVDSDESTIQRLENEIEDLEEDGGSKKKQKEITAKKKTLEKLKNKVNKVRTKGLEDLNVKDTHGKEPGFFTWDKLRGISAAESTTLNYYSSRPLCSLSSVNSKKNAKGSLELEITDFFDQLSKLGNRRAKVGFTLLPQRLSFASGMRALNQEFDKAKNTLEDLEKVFKKVAYNAKDMSNKFNGNHKGVLAMVVSIQRSMVNFISSRKYLLDSTKKPVKGLFGTPSVK